MTDETRKSFVGPFGYTAEAESGVPDDIRRELMDCAVSNGRISYPWLLRLYKRGVEAGNYALSTRLEEVGVAENTRGEIVEACPGCGNHIDQKPISGYVTRVMKAWWCGACEFEYDEPAYWQRVKGPS